MAKFFFYYSQMIVTISSGKCATTLICVLWEARGVILLIFILKD